MIHKPELVKHHELTEKIIGVFYDTYNELGYTKECVDSIRLRTDEPYELIFVDNGSTDRQSRSQKSFQDQLNLRIFEKAGVRISALRNLGYSSQEARTGIESVDWKVSPSTQEALATALKALGRK